MPTLADIPENVRESPNITPFMQWLRSTPTNFTTRRTLAYLWSQKHKMRLSRANWTELATTATPPELLRG